MLSRVFFLDQRKVLSETCCHVSHTNSSTKSWFRQLRPILSRIISPTQGLCSRTVCFGSENSNPISHLCYFSLLAWPQQYPRPGYQRDQSHQCSFPLVRQPYQSWISSHHLGWSLVPSRKGAWLPRILKHNLKPD